MEISSGNRSCGFTSSVEASHLINRYGNGAPWVKHCSAVSRVASCLSDIFAAKYAINIEFIRTASLLHDIGRYKTQDPILHGIEGYRLLISLGYVDEAFVCASHVLYGLSSAEASRYGLPEQDFIPISFEEKLIPLIDFLVEHDRAVSLDKRFESLRLRNSANKDFLMKLEKAEVKARTFMHRLNSEFNISMEELAARILQKE
ncbi:MAG: HDIG domain-containing protein [Nitrospirae bacterium]|nr:HDIG domain-containing protein [Nitrospirota bacterium]MCL5422460.1 HDIG domain-containing protein [Nitrospirota bacterium]